MTEEAFLRLTLLALSDDDAIVVLQDAEAEMTGEFRRRISNLVLEHFSWWEINTGPRVNAFAIAAVLLFESWPTSWPLAMRCRRPRIPRIGHGEYSVPAYLSPLPRALLFQVDHGPPSERQGNGTENG